MSGNETYYKELFAARAALKENKAVQDFEGTITDPRILNALKTAPAFRSINNLILKEVRDNNNSDLETAMIEAWRMDRNAEKPLSSDLYALEVAVNDMPDKKAALTAEQKKTLLSEMKDDGAKEIVTALFKKEGIRPVDISKILRRGEEGTEALFNGKLEDLSGKEMAVSFWIDEAKEYELRFLTAEIKRSDLNLRGDNEDLFLSAFAMQAKANGSGGISEKEALTYGALKELREQYPDFTKLIDLAGALAQKGVTANIQSDREVTAALIYARGEVEKSAGGRGGGGK